MRVSLPPAVDHGTSNSEVGAATRKAEPLYARIMDDTWFQLAEPIRALHSTQSTTRAEGWMRVEHGCHRLAAILARRLRLPQSTAAAHTELTVTPLDGGERWRRTIGGRRLETWQYRANASELSERYGCLEFRFRLHVSDGRLLYVQREAALRLAAGRLRLPGYLAPHVEAHEDAAGQGRVSVGVSVTLPGIGLLIAYDGVVDVADARA